MISREIVLRAIEFQNPERIPGTMPAPYWHDTYGSGIDYPMGPEAQWRKVSETRWERMDEWGNIYARVDAYSGGEVARGVLEDLTQVKTFPLPDLDNPTYYERAHRAYATPEAQVKFKTGFLPGFAFNVARKTRRLDQYLMDLVLNPDEIGILHERLNDLLERIIRQFARAGADGVFFCEDWATQKRLMVSPSMWREVFKPGFVRLCDAAHEEGLKVLMHSCGKITPIIPDLIEAGIDVLQFDQPQVHGIDTLAQWSGQVTFWCPVDIQTTLQTRDPVRIEADAKEMIAKLGNKGGGFIAGYYGGYEAIDIPSDVQEIACKAFQKHGWYQKVGGA